MEQQRRMIYTPTRAVPRRFLHVLCFALSFFITVSCIALAEPPHHNQEPHCPKNCKDLPIEYPFGAALGCGSPGFLLDCNVEGDLPAWVLPVDTAQPPPQYFVVRVELNNHYNGSFYIRDAAMSDCTDVHSAENRVPLNPSSLKFAEFSMYSKSVDILVFDCPTPQPGNPPGFTDNSSVCKAFVNKCCHNRQDTPTKCFLTNSVDADFGFLMSHHGCSSYTVLSNVPTPLPRPFPSPSDNYIHLQWSNLLNARACDKCMQSNGTCGYDVDDHESNGGFRCLCPGGKSYSTACPSGCRGIHCRSIRDLAIALPVVALVLIVAATVSCKFWRRKQRTMEGNSSRKRTHFSSVPSGFNVDGLAEKPLEFSYKALAIATNFFSLKLGEGAFGVVYKGVLRNGDSVAVKVLDGSRQGDKQFVNEVASIGTIHHVNLVKLVGFCYQNSNRILVYEYIINSSLDKHLFTERKPSVLHWNRRYSIALGTARGLAYLHRDCRKRIIHCDIKPQNILLDADFCPKIADFGLAKLMNRDESQALTTVRGTPGYIAPEFWSLRDGPLTDKCDVYSFGMLLFEIIGGRRNMDLNVTISQLYFPEWAFNQLGKEIDVLLQLVDKRIAGDASTSDREQVRVMSVVALWCIQQEPSMRPSMSRVVQYLEGSVEVPLHPPFPFTSKGGGDAPLGHNLTSMSSSV